MIKFCPAFIASLLLISVALVPVAGALTPEERLDNPELEERARGLSAELRCLVCQNQSIDDSDSPFAQDLRRLIRREIEEGRTDGEIRMFLRDRYGDYVLLSPPLNSTTLALWVAPFALLVVGILGLALARRGRPGPDTGDENEVS